MSALHWIAVLFGIGICAWIGGRFVYDCAVDAIATLDDFSEHDAPPLDEEPSRFSRLARSVDRAREAETSKETNNA